MPFLIPILIAALFVAHAHREAEADRRHRELLEAIEASKPTPIAPPAK